MAQHSMDIRELQQDASAAVARAADGEVLIVTDHGSPVARLAPLGATCADELVARGLARPQRRRLADLPRPEGAVDTTLSAALRADRDDHHH